MLDKGILIFALGHPYYGRYAFNLAASIKAVENIPICIIHSGSSLSHLTEEQMALFDYMTHSEVKPGCAAKLHGYQLSPFDKTLMLDADMVWLPVHKPTELFDQLAGIEFTGITEGSTEKPSGHYFFWAEVSEIREKYKVDGIIHQWRTEVIYFERNEKVAGMFNQALDIHKDHGLSKVKQFAEGIPDELAINIAAAVAGLNPHKENWQPSYWPQMYQNQLPGLSVLYDKYYTLSLGGNHTTENVKRVYNNLMQAQSRKVGLSHVFPAQSKHYFLPERRKS